MFSRELSATRPPTRAAPQSSFASGRSRRPPPTGTARGAGKLTSSFQVPRRRVGLGREGGAGTTPPKAPLRKGPGPAASAPAGKERKLRGSGQGRERAAGRRGTRRSARPHRLAESGWSQRPGAASAFKMQIDSLPPPPSRPGERGSAARQPPTPPAPRAPSGRLYLSGARGATRHSPGARGRGGRSAAELPAHSGGRLAPLGSRAAEVAGALG